MTWAQVSQVCDMLQSWNVQKEICGHLSVYNSLQIEHPDLPGHIMLLAHPFSQLPYHCKQRQDYAVWRPNYIETPQHVKPCPHQGVCANHHASSVKYR